MMIITRQNVDIGLPCKCHESGKNTLALFER